MRGAYIYEGLEAEWYDLLDELADFDDFDFYRLCLQASPGQALDLGCGTGRILVPLVALGERVVGLDASPLMLDQCRDNLSARGLKTKLYLADMREFDLGSARFSTIFVPGFTIQLLTDDEELVSCLRSCRKHLREDGQLVLSTYMPWDMIWEERDSSPLELRREVEADDRSVLRTYQAWELDRRNQLLHLRNRYERQWAEGQAKVEEKRMTLRWHLPHEMLALLEEVGLRNVAMYGDFNPAPPDEESESVIYVAGR